MLACVCLWQTKHLPNRLETQTSQARDWDDAWMGGGNRARTHCLISCENHLHVRPSLSSRCKGMCWKTCSQTVPRSGHSTALILRRLHADDLLLFALIESVRLSYMYFHGRRSLLTFAYEETRESFIFKLLTKKNSFSNFE